MNIPSTAPSTKTDEFETTVIDTPDVVVDDTDDLEEKDVNKETSDNEIEVEDLNSLGIETIDDIVYKRQELDDILDNLKQTGMVDKATRVALESYDARSMLPNKNGYTAEPSKINYNETLEFVETVKVNVDTLGGDAILESCRRKIKKSLKRLDDITPMTDMIAQVNEYNKVSYETLKLKPPSSGNIESLHNKLLEDGVSDIIDELDAQTTTENVLSTTKVFHDGGDIADRMLCISRFRVSLFEQIFAGTLNSAALSLAQTPDEVADSVLDLLSKVDNLKDNISFVDVDVSKLKMSNYDQATVINSKVKVDTSFADDYISDKSLTSLYRPSDSLPGQLTEVIDVPSILKYCLESISETTMSSNTEGSTENDTKNRIQDLQQLKTALTNIDSAITTYVDIVTNFNNFTKKAIKFNKSFIKVMELVIDEAKNIIDEAQ